MGSAFSKGWVEEQWNGNLPLFVCSTVGWVGNKTPLGTHLLAGNVLFVYNHRTTDWLELEGLKTISFHPLAMDNLSVTLLTNLFTFDNECRGNNF